MWVPGLGAELNVNGWDGKGSREGSLSSEDVCVDRHCYQKDPSGWYRSSRRVGVWTHVVIRRTRVGGHVDKACGTADNQVRVIG